VNDDDVARLAEAMARAMLDKLGVGRSCYTPAEVAQRAGLSEAFVYRSIAAGELRVVRPGGRTIARVLPEHEALWLRGQRSATDTPVVGIEAARSELAARRRA
jgi:excisionase family DNA binding protein